MTFFNQDFFQQLVTTFFGVAAGIPAALWIERKIQESSERAESQQLVTAIREAASKNLELANKLVSEFHRNGLSHVPLYPMDMTTLSATASRRYQLLKSVIACRRVDHAAYELVELDGKLKMLRDMSCEGSRSPQSFAVFEMVQKACRDQLPTVIQAQEMVLKELDTYERGKS